MIYAVVGSGGKTTLIHRLASRWQCEGKKVFITTTTHMGIEPDTLLTDDADRIIAALNQYGCVMAGIPMCSENAGTDSDTEQKIVKLSSQTYDKVTDYADITLVEADGSRHHPIKYPNATEPVIPEYVDGILIVVGLHALNHSISEVAQRLDLVLKCLQIEADALLTPAHISNLLREGYLEPLHQNYPDKPIWICPTNDGSLLHRQISDELAGNHKCPFLTFEDLTFRARNGVPEYK